MTTRIRVTSKLAPSVKITTPPAATIDPAILIQALGAERGRMPWALAMLFPRRWRNP